MTVGYDTKGKQKRKAFYGKAKKEVQEKMTAAKAELDKGNIIDSSKMTLADWLDIWLVEYKKRSIRPNTFKAYNSVITQNIKPTLGKYKLKVLRHEMVQKFVNDLSDKDRC